MDGKCLNGLHPGTYRIKYSIKGEPLVSIIVPSIRIENLEKCIESIFTKSTYKKFEIIVIDGSQTNEISNFTQKFPNTYRFKNPILKFNFSKINNFGVSKSKGEYVIFLNDDTEVIEPSWIEELLGQAQRKEVGIVGAKLLYPENKVQHAGTIIGIRGYAGNYGGFPNNDPHYFALHLMIRDVSAVTAACMMMSRELFDLVGGFDEELGRAWQDVDLCLRTLQIKKYIVYTPFSLLYHYEGGTRGRGDPSDEELKARSMFRKKYIVTIQNGDPYYNPNLSILEPYVPDTQYITTSDPLEILIKIYNNRPDLQREFPEVNEGKYQRLIDWASTYGVTQDYYRNRLLEFNYYYMSNASENVKELARSIFQYNNNPSMIEKFTEVLDGNFINIKKID